MCFLELHPSSSVNQLGQPSYIVGVQKCMKQFMAKVPPKMLESLLMAWIQMQKKARQGTLKIELNHEN